MKIIYTLQCPCLQASIKAWRKGIVYKGKNAKLGNTFLRHAENKIVKHVIDFYSI